MSPGPRVLAELGLEGVEAVPLPGGQGEAWRAGDVVLKPVADLAAHDWSAGVMAAVDVGDAVRVQRPVPTRDGGWSVAGWCGWTWVEGEHSATRWPELIEAGRALVRSLSEVPRPDVLDRRTDIWAVADRVVWGEARHDVVHAELGPVIQRLGAMVADHPIDAPSQLIHTDLSGNVVFAEGLAPAVIDMSPGWRPAEYAAAIAVVDAIAWWQADPILLQEIEEPALLVRAALFRAVTTDLHARGREHIVASSVSEWTGVADLLAG